MGDICWSPAIRWRSEKRLHVNTTNDAVVLNAAVNGTVVAIVVSRDSQTAWILGRSAQAVIVIVNLPRGAPQQVGSPVFLRDPISAIASPATPRR